MNLNHLCVGEHCPTGCVLTPKTTMPLPIEERIGNAFRRALTAEIMDLDKQERTGPAVYHDMLLRQQGLDAERYRQALIDLHPRTMAAALIRTCATVTAGHTMVWNPDMNLCVQQLPTSTLSVEPCMHGLLDAKWCQYVPDTQELRLILWFFEFDDFAPVLPIQQRLDLLSIALISNKIHGCNSVEICRVFPSTWPQGIQVDVIEDWDWDEVEQRVLKVWKARDSMPVPGDWCAKCPLAAECKVAQVQEWDL